MSTSPGDTEKRGAFSDATDDFPSNDPGYGGGWDASESTGDASRGGPPEIKGVEINERPAPDFPFAASADEPGGDLVDRDAESRNFSPLHLRDRVTIMLLFREKVHVDKVEAAWNAWREDTRRGANHPLWRYLLVQKDVDREAIFAEAADVYAFPKANVTPQQAVRFIDKNSALFTDKQWEEMRRLALLPVARENVPHTAATRWIFATHDPTRPEAALALRRFRLDLYDLQYVSEAFTATVVSSALQFRNAYLIRANKAGNTRNLGTSFAQPEIDESALEAEIAGSTLINLFEAMLVEGVRRGASDIHVYVSPQRTIEIHFRIDGQLTLWREEDRSLPEAFLAVVKDNSIGIDRFERDTAQDGFIQRLVDDVVIRFRVSVVPLATARSEDHFDSIVIRILDDRKAMTDLGKLGFEGAALETFEWATDEPHGMVIITGPTGSGKSTTLYAALSRVVNPARNVLSIEDPVEYLVPGVRQVKLSHKFRVEDAIRSILRHDPDVVMVGEMRDSVTADLAIKLANTGHLTFSTLHTNDAASAITRLYNMGIEPFLIANALTLVASQRLVRVLCPDCKQEDPRPDPILLGRLGLTLKDISKAKIYRQGDDRECATCGGTGYRGRRAVVEVMPVTEEIRRLIMMGQDVIDEVAIREVAAIQGMHTLMEVAVSLVRVGTTSLQEATSVGISRSGIAHSRTRFRRQ